MEYLHNKSQVLYNFIKPALFQNEKGEWRDAIIYKNEEGMVFVRLREDFEKSFTKKI